MPRVTKALMKTAGALSALALCVTPTVGQDLGLTTLPDGVQSSHAPLRLTLDEAIARGVKASYRLEELRARQEGAEASLAGRHADGRPQLALEGGYTRTSHVDEYGLLTPEGTRNIIFPDVPDNYRARVGLGWLLYNGGRTESLVRAADAERGAAVHDVTAATVDVRLDVTRAFWLALTTREAARVVQASTVRMDAHLRDVRTQLDAGLIPPNDVLSVEAQRSRQQAQLVEAENASAVVLADLRRLTGIDPDTPIELDAQLEQLPETAAPIDSLLDDARSRRADRQALEQRLTALASRRAAAESQLRPSVTLSGGVDYARPNPRILPRVDRWEDFWDVGINARWPIWEGGRVKAEAAEIAAAERAARARLDEFDSLLGLDIRQRRLDLESARASVSAVSEAVRSAAEARRVVGERFNAGVATSLDVLDAQLVLLQTELERTRMLAAVHLAAARLDRTVGR